MNFSLSVTAKARDDITRNAAWWAEHYSLDEALRWYDTIYEQLGTLKQFPERHGVAPENDEFDMKSERSHWGSDLSGPIEQCLRLSCWKSECSLCAELRKTR